MALYQVLYSFLSYDPYNNPGCKAILSSPFIDEKTEPRGGKCAWPHSWHWARVWRWGLCFTNCPFRNQKVNLFTLDFAKILELTQFWLLHRPTWILAIDFSMTGASSGQLLVPVSSPSQGWALRGQSLLGSRSHFLDWSSGSVWASNTQRTGAKLHLIILLSLQDFPSKAALLSPLTLTGHQPPPWWPCLFMLSPFVARLHHLVCLPCRPCINSRRGQAGLFCRAPVYMDCWVGFHEPEFTLNLWNLADQLVASPAVPAGRLK